MFESAVHRILSTLPASGAGIYNGTDVLAQPISLFLVQATLIIGLCRFLGLFGHYLQQPSVIFEIVAGVLLGPSALCRNAYFKQAIFPTSSLANLQIVASVGLTFYLFIVGLELDVKLLRTHARKTSGISIAGIAVPFAIGIAISRELLDTLQPESDVEFESFFVFIGTAMSITAFPVLARMLKEGGLIYTKAGSMALGAAALDDAIAWTLLALSISIASGNGSMKEAGYIFATVILIAGFLLLIVKPLFELLVEYAEVNNVTIITNNLFALTICLLFMFAWITEFIGLDTIFGAFLFGLAVPRGTRLFHQCREYIENFVLTFTLPLYFALSGLKTDITTINNNEEGAMIVLVIVCATGAKFFGVGLASWLSGLNVRESTTVATLMNTRGLVELIVLNVGLNAKILNTRTFSVMVIMALATTFMTAPIIALVYPENMRKRGDVELAEEKEKKNRLASGDKDAELIAVPETSLDKISNRVGIVIENLTQMQSMINSLTYFLPKQEGTELNVTVMHFHEPTKTLEHDQFIGFNDEGRLIRVEEEPTDLVQAITMMQKDPSIKKPELLPISSFCHAFSVPVNAFHVEGDPVEYPLELRTISASNGCSLLCFPFKADSSFSAQFFWSYLYVSASPVALVMELQNYEMQTHSAHNRDRSRSRDRSHSLFSGYAAAEIMEDIEHGITGSASTAPTLYTSLPTQALPIHRRRNSTRQFQRFDTTPKKTNKIVVLITGNQVDTAVLAMLERLTEDPMNDIHVLIPNDEENFLEVVREKLNEAKNTYKTNVQVTMHELHHACRDHDGLHSDLMEEFPEFDLFVCGFIEPREDPAQRILHSRTRRASLSGGNGDNTPSALAQAGNAILDMILPNEPSDRVTARLDMKMPLNCVYSNLEHPELGVIGSKVYEGRTKQTKSALVMIIHEPLKAKGNRTSIASEKEDNKNDVGDSKEVKVLELEKVL